MIEEKRLYDRDPDRTSFLLEINPWVADIDMRNALLYRGVIVSAWAYVDTSLTDLVIRSSYLDEYGGALRRSFPKKLRDRREYMQAALKINGPLNPWLKVGVKILDRIAEQDELRNIMAHSKMTLAPRRGFEFVDFRENGGSIICRRRIYSLIELRRFAILATRLSRLIQRTVYALNKAQVLPDHPQ
jgi:hypothetical protein